MVGLLGLFFFVGLGECQTTGAAGDSRTGAFSLKGELFSFSLKRIFSEPGVGKTPLKSLVAFAQDEAVYERLRGNLPRALRRDASQPFVPLVSCLPVRRCC